MKALTALAAAALVASALVAGCESSPRMEERQAPGLSVTRNHSTIVTGETTAIFAKTANVFGRNADIHWSTTLGHIMPVEGGRMAYFTSDQPGTAVITAELNVDGRLLRDHTNVTVNAVR